MGIATIMSAYNNEHRAIYPAAYLAGIELFNEQRYYEAHEAWEDIWRESQGDVRLFYQGLIQAAAALLHYDRNNLVGTKLCMTNALKKLDTLGTEFMSLQVASFSQQLREFVIDAWHYDEQSRLALLSQNSDQPHPQIILMSSRSES